MKIDRTLAYAVTLLALAMGTARAAEKPAAEKPAAEKPAAEKPKAAETSHVRAPRTQRVIELKNRERLQELERLADGFGVNHQGSPELGIIILSGPADAVAATAEAIQKYDIPRDAKVRTPDRNAELTAYLVVARPDGDPAPIPGPLTAVVDQLKASFPYRRYELVETLVLRVRENGQAVSSGVLPALSPGTTAKTFYHLSVRRVWINGPDGSATLGLNPVELKVEAPFPAEASGPAGAGMVQRRENTLSTTTDIREGQKVVLGKAPVDGSGGSLILILTARVVE
jgi:hypothetical protein